LHVGGDKHRAGSGPEPHRRQAFGHPFLGAAVTHVSGLIRHPCIGSVPDSIPASSGPYHPVRTLPFTHPPVFQPSLPSQTSLCFHSHPDCTDEVSSPSPTPSKFRGSPSFPFTPSSHGCEGVNGKLGGAIDAARKTGWARAEARERPDDGCSNPPDIPPGERPESAPDAGAYCGAHFRANSRAISRSKSTIPQSIAGAVFQPFRALRTVVRAQGETTSSSTPRSRNPLSASVRRRLSAGAVRSGSGSGNSDHECPPRARR